MTGTDIEIAICGSAGDGTIATGDILNKAMARAGYRVIAFDVYPAEIRGFGKCIARTRITTDTVYSMKEKTDVLVSLNDGHAIAHVVEVGDYGAVIYDDAPILTLKEGEHISGHVKAGQLPYGLPLREISERATGGAKSRNMVVLGYMAGLYGMPHDVFVETIAEKFRTKDKVITDGNIAAFEFGYDEGASAFKLDFIEFGKPASVGRNVVMMDGNTAVVRGCLDAGVDMVFGYPITPATSILESLADKLPKRGGRFLQTEDEIAAISAVIGAAFTGARAATATSGPGFALMSEMMGLGVMAEVPCVIFVSQRGGPSTGMPTKTEQSDLNIAVYGSAGDGQRIVIAPTNVEGCYRCAGRAFEMAERYQTPVVVLLDLYLSNRNETVELPARNPFEQDLVKGFAKHNKKKPYQRFALTKDGVSPRALPGEKGGIHTVTGLEHNEGGRPRDDSATHGNMTEKRHEKLKPAVNHPGISITKRFGDSGKVDIGLITWGSTFGESLAAMLVAQGDGISCAAMKVVMMSPLPVDAIKAFTDDCRVLLVPELNYEGQFANILASAVPREIHRLSRVPGMPMRVEDILAEVRRLAKPRKKRRDAA